MESPAHSRSQSGGAAFRSERDEDPMRAVLRNMFRSVVSLVALGALVGIPAGPAMAATAPYVSSHDGRCLDADIATATHNGTKAQVWQCIGGSNQNWTVYTDQTIRSAWDGRCLDEDIAGGTHNGTKVQVWDCNGWDNQQWHR
jgi:hypothetical protein